MHTQYTSHYAQLAGVYPLIKTFSHTKTKSELKPSCNLRCYYSLKYVKSGRLLTAPNARYFFCPLTSESTHADL
jgi:hypothetical protein